MEKQHVLVLDTDYKRTGNSDGMQISTLSMAVFGSDWNETYDNSFDYLCEAEANAMKDYNHERDFMASLTPDVAAQYVDNAQAYAAALTAYGEAKEEACREDELPEADPFYTYVQEARDWYEENMRNEWINGDRSDPGVLGKAAKVFEGFEFFYFEGNDEITFTVEEWKREELSEDEEIEGDEAIAKYLANRVNETAEYEHNKEQEERATRRAERERVRAYQAERAAKEEEARKEKLRAIAEGNK